MPHVHFRFFIRRQRKVQKKVRRELCITLIENGLSLCFVAMATVLIFIFPPNEKSRQVDLKAAFPKVVANLSLSIEHVCWFCSRP